MVLEPPGGGTLLIASRSERRPGEPLAAVATIKNPVPSGNFGQAEVCFEGRSLAIRNGEFEDAFLPHDVHVYRLS